MATIVAERVPVTMLAEVVMELGLVPDFEDQRRLAPADPYEARRVLARLAVDAAERRDAVRPFAQMFCRKLFQDSDLYARLYEFTQTPDGSELAQEAALVLRARTLRLPDLRSRLFDWEQWICVVAAGQENGQTKLGTGVLIGPDLVLTAYHNVRSHIDMGAERNPAPGPLLAIFDHLYGEPVTDPQVLHPDCVSVPFRKEGWLVACCEDWPGDGTVLYPDKGQEEELRRKLDFAVLRLAEPIGRQARNINIGGARRRWLRLVPSSGTLRHEDRIIIPQHPGGSPQRIDFGRFSETATQCDTSGTRLRYTTETAKGTSGAPCFNQQFEFVGLHNASFEPGGLPVANQAIHLQHILDHLKDTAFAKELLSTAAPLPSILWKVSSDPKSNRVILGRRPLLNWIEQAAAENPASRANRIYAAVCRGEGDPGRSTTGFGKSFTIEILRAARRDKGERFVVLGTKEERAPTSVADVIQSIADQLSIPAEALEGMPQRPTLGASGSSGDMDKLNLWATDEVPAWFKGVLGRHREVRVDLREEARAEMAHLKEFARPVPESVRALAESAAPTFEVRSRWNILWIILDQITDFRMPDEVRNLFAGLTGGKLPETTMPAELRRLRWLFLGYVPDFLVKDDVTPELLDPMEVGVDAMLATLEAHAAALDKPLDEGQAVMAKACIDSYLSEEALAPYVGNPNRRLAKLQSFVSSIPPKIMSKVSS
ncbi:serine protease [Azospirillum sp. TSO35-2]|uniref:trypsin-like serine peptidase n=1 Tax=Azospirillum sp. TSO35-2 TaxID=716796 RepID=UPI001304A54D|nr:serine protease [Azospirillum sp. TSO35-2]